VIETDCWLVSLLLASVRAVCALMLILQESRSALRAERGRTVSAYGGREPARITQALVVVVLAHRGIFAVESTLATKSDEIAVAQRPNALAPFFDRRVRRNHFGNRVVTRRLAQPGRGVSFPCTASVLIAAGEPGLVPLPNSHFPGSAACQNQCSEASSKRLKGCDFLRETRSPC
jgi:hypothetical protein